MRIGVDIDGVISDSYPVWLQELNLHFGKNIGVLTDYNLHLDFEVPAQEIDGFFIGNAERLMMMPNPISGAKEGIETLLREGHEVIYITARSPEDKEVTVRWFAEHRIHHEQVLFTGFKNKVDFVKQWDIEVFIEDYQVNAQLIAECGVPVFLLNTSYNQTNQLPTGVTRCRGWDEIVQGIRGM